LDPHKEVEILGPIFLAAEMSVNHCRYIDTGCLDRAPLHLMVGVTVYPGHKETTKKNYTKKRKNKVLNDILCNAIILPVRDSLFRLYKSIAYMHHKANVGNTLK